MSMWMAASVVVLKCVLMNDKLRRGNPRAQHAHGADVVARHGEAAERPFQVFERQAGIEHSAKRHVAGDAGEAIEIENSSHQYRGLLLANPYSVVRAATTVMVPDCAKSRLRSRRKHRLPSSICLRIKRLSDNGSEPGPKIHETIWELVRHGVSVASTLAVLEGYTAHDAWSDRESAGVRAWAGVLRREMQFERRFMAACGRLMAGAVRRLLL